MMKLLRTALTVACVFAAAMAFADPPPPPAPPPPTEPPPPAQPPAGGCQSDKDCKGDRICVNGQCADPVKGAPVKPKPDVTTVRYTGTLSGGGSLSFRLTGTSLSNGSASVGGVSFSLRSGVAPGKSFAMVGNTGQDFLQLSGNWRADKASVTGTYNGTVQRRKVTGSFSATRR